MQPILPGITLAPTPSLTLTGSAPDMRAWQVGQLLQAQAVSNTVNNQVTLRIGLINVEAQTQTPITAGQTLTVQVVQLGEQPILKLVPTQAPGVAADPLAAAVRSALPRQPGIAQPTGTTSPPLSAKTIIPGSTTPTVPLTLTVTTSGPSLRAWQVGQMLQAQAITGTVNNQVTLRIGLTNIGAQTQAPISAGQNLTVQVIRLGEQPVLKLVPTQAAPAATDPLTAALRSALPRQTGLAPLLANLGLLAQSASSNATSPPLPANVMQAAAQIYRDLTGSHQAATARGLQQAIRDTGLFLESKLAQLAHGGTAEVGTDLKAALLRLQALLSDTPRPAITATATTPTTTLPQDEQPELPAPPLRNIPLQAQAASAPSLAHAQVAAAALDELQRQTEGTLARVQLNQLASLPSTTETQPSWLLELPIRHQAQVDLFHLRIEREAQNKSVAATEGRPWVVTLAFDLPGLGPVHARVAVLGEQVSTTFWAEQARTTQAFHNHLETLRQNLHQAGLGVGNLNCHTGQPPYPPSTPQPPIMDTRA